METKTYKSNPARDGLILATVTVVITLLSTILSNGLVSSLLWLIKIIGSIMVLRAFMSVYGQNNEGQSTFGYGFKVTLCSSFVCAIWAFAMYKFIVPDIASEAFRQAYDSIASYGVPLDDATQNMLYKIEDNYPQYICIFSFFWDALLGLMFSGILSTGTTRRDIFGKEDEEDEL